MSKHMVAQKRPAELTEPYIDVVSSSKDDEHKPSPGICDLDYEDAAP